MLEHDANKICTTILSCSTEEQLQVAWAMYELFQEKYEKVFERSFSDMIITSMWTQKIVEIRAENDVCNIWWCDFA